VRDAASRGSWPPAVVLALPPPRYWRCRRRGAGRCRRRGAADALASALTAWRALSPPAARPSTTWVPHSCRCCDMSATFMSFAGAGMRWPRDPCGGWDQGWQ